MPEDLEKVPEQVAETVSTVPETTIHVAQSGAEETKDAVKELAGLINSSLNELTTVQRELLDHLKAAKEQTQDVIEEPLEGSSETATEVAPEVTEPQLRTIRRNGRKLKRNA